MESLSDSDARRWSDAIVDGDAMALASLYDARFEWMRRVLERATKRDEPFVLDCVQDAWLRVAQRPVRCSSAASLDAWLRRVALSAALDRVRADASRRWREVAVARERPDAAPDSNRSRAESLARQVESIDSVRTALHHALDSVDARDHALLVMRFRAGMTLSQIAAACGLGAAAVDSRLRRAMHRLKEAIE